MTEPYVNKPWRKGMSRRYTHRWLPTLYAGDAEPPRITPRECWDLTCQHCGLRKMQGAIGAGRRWHYKRPTWSKWRVKGDFCALRPDAPKERRKYEREVPRR